MEFLNSYLKSIETSLDRIPAKTEPASLYEPCRYVLGNGGKRLRPVLTLIANGLCGGELEEALPAALSMELIHNFTLVHDDLMDHAESRRGSLTVHIKWNRPIAILAGDILYAEAFEQLLAYGENESGRRPGLFHDLQRELLHGTRTVCEGQALDLELEQVRHATTGQYLAMIEGKTGALISTALVLGGLVAGSGDTELERLRELGKIMGVAFQIQDDLMDATADPDKFGKIPGGDIREGKTTYLMIKALELGNETQCEELYRLMQTREEDGAENDEVVNSVIRLYRETGAIDVTRERVTSDYHRTLELLNSFDDSKYKADLERLVAYLIQRES